MKASRQTGRPLVHSIRRRALFVVLHTVFNNTVRQGGNGEEGRNIKNCYLLKAELKKAVTQKEYTCICTHTHGH